MLGTHKISTITSSLATCIDYSDSFPKIRLTIYRDALFDCFVRTLETNENATRKTRKAHKRFFKKYFWVILNFYLNTIIPGKQSWIKSSNKWTENWPRIDQRYTKKGQNWAKYSKLTLEFTKNWLKIGNWSLFYLERVVAPSFSSDFSKKSIHFFSFHIQYFPFLARVISAAEQAYRRQSEANYNIKIELLRV